MAITSAGVGSGIDIESIISGLMEVERAPLVKFEQKKNDINIRVSAYGSLKSELSSLKDLATTLGDKTKFGKFNASSSNEEIFTATATSGAINEDHEIVVDSLAVAHRMTSAAFTDATAAVGTGTYSFGYGDTSFDVTIDGDNNSLEGLRNAINDAPENDGISASIINVDGGSRLVLTAREAGTANAITAPGMFSELTAAEDAVLWVDGFQTTSSSNTLTDVIPGVTINLKGEGTAQLSTERDVESLKEQMTSFVNKYNAINISIKTMGEGSLEGDTMPKGFEGKMRTLFFEAIALPNGDSRTAFDLGFTFDKTGKLSVDEDVIDDLTTSDLEAFVGAFTNTDNGFATKVKDVVSIYTQAGGLIDTRTTSLSDSVGYIDNQIERFEWRMDQVEGRYRRQFAAMDAMVAQLQTSGNYMASQLASLNNQ